MREYGQIWIDDAGKERPVFASKKLTFKYPGHAALRSFVYKRDGFTCRWCRAMPKYVPIDYDGHKTLSTTRKSKSGFTAPLVIDHVVSIRNGGTNHPDNLQTLCDSCNSAKTGLVDSKAEH